MKRYSINNIIGAIILLFFSLSASAQYSEKVEIYFEKGSSVVDRGYGVNNEILSRLEAKLKHSINDSTIKKIIVDSYTSPEGGVAFNKDLSLRRAKAIGDYINNLGLNIPMSLIEVNSNGIAWNELRELVSESDMPTKGLIVKIIDDVPEETWVKVSTSRWLQLVDSRNKHLMDLKGGNPYRYMMDNIFPLLRSGSVVTIYFIEEGAHIIEEPEPEPEIESEPEPESIAEESKSESAVEEPEPEIEPEIEPESIVEESKPEPAAEESEIEPEPESIAEKSKSESAAEESKPEEEPEPELVIEEVAPVVEEPEYDTIYKPLFALKTNLLYDAVTVLNAEIEVPIGKRWSIAGEFIFPWWTSCGSSYNNWQTNSQRNTLQLLQGNLEVKYWFGDRTDRLPLTGWNAALGGGFGLYDFEYKTKGYQGEFYVIYTLSGGYAHTINKRGNLRLEYSLGFGYLQTNYDKYEEHLGIDDQWHTIRTAMGKFSWFGPTKAEVSLVWMLNRRVYETK